MASSNDDGCVTVLKIVLAILLPPLAVFLHVGLTTHFWINLILTILGYLPGQIHAIWVLIAKPEGPPAPRAY